jgi:hypothetical protein
MQELQILLILGTTDVKLAAKYIQTGTAASAGGARIVCILRTEQ